MRSRSTPRRARGRALRESRPPQVDRSTRLQRRGQTVEVNAASLVVVTQMLCAFWHLADAPITPRVTALSWARAWNQARNVVVALAHGLGLVLGGVDPPIAVTEALAQFAGRETPRRPVIDREAIRGGVNEIHERTAKVTLRSARRAVA